MEIAFISANKIHIEIEKKRGGLMGKVLARLTRKPSKFIAAMLIGSNIALVIYSLVLGDVLTGIFANWKTLPYGVVQLIFTDLGLLAQISISTFIFLLTAEFLPKILFQIYSNTLLKLLAAPTYFFYLL